MNQQTRRTTTMVVAVQDMDQQTRKTPTPPARPQTSPREAKPAGEGGEVMDSAMRRLTEASEVIGRAAAQWKNWAGAEGGQGIAQMIAEIADQTNLRP